MAARKGFARPAVDTAPDDKQQHRALVLEVRERGNHTSKAMRTALRDELASLLPALRFAVATGEIRLLDYASWLASHALEPMEVAAPPGLDGMLQGGGVVFLPPRMPQSIAAITERAEVVGG